MQHYMKITYKGVVLNLELGDFAEIEIDGTIFQAWSVSQETLEISGDGEIETHQCRNDSVSVRLINK